MRNMEQNAGNGNFSPPLCGKDNNKELPEDYVNMNTLNKKPKKIYKTNITKDKLNRISEYKNISDTVIADKIKGVFNNTEFNLKEQNILTTKNKKYTGVINSKNAEFIVNPGNWNMYKGKIQGIIGDNSLNFIAETDLFGRQVIVGIYNNLQIELNISKDFFATHIEGKNTNIMIRKNFVYNDKSYEGKFEYPNELLPVILAFIKCSESAKK